MLVCTRAKTMRRRDGTTTRRVRRRKGYDNKVRRFVTTAVAVAILPDSSFLLTLRKIELKLVQLVLSHLQVFPHKRCFIITISCDSCCKDPSTNSAIVVVCRHMFHNSGLLCSWRTFLLNGWYVHQGNASLYVLTSETTVDVAVALEKKSHARFMSSACCTPPCSCYSCCCYVQDVEQNTATQSNYSDDSA